MIVSEGTPGRSALAAFYAFTVKLGPPRKDARASTGSYSYTYLSLPALLDHVSTSLTEAGLAIAQEVTGDAETIAVTTYLIHVEGGTVSFGPAVFPALADPQKRGSAISYARRYALLAALGLAAEDDDAASATMTTGLGGPGSTGKEGPGPSPSEGGGAGAEAGPASLPSPDDIQATQAHYHPGKPHAMIVSPQTPAIEICTRGGCSFTQRKGVA